MSKMKKKRIVAFAMVFLMLLTLIPSVKTVEGAESKDLFNDTSIAMNEFTLGAKYKDENGVNQSIVIESEGDYELPYNSTVDLMMKFVVGDASKIDGSVDYIYTVPAGIRVDVNETKDLVTSSGKKIGTVDISNSGKLIFHFDETAINDGSDVSFYVGFNGGFSSEFEEDGHSQRISFPTGAGDYSFDITSIGKDTGSDDPANTDVIIDKSGTMTAPIDGVRYVKWNVSLGGNGRSTFGGQIVDNLASGLSYVDYAGLPDSLKSEFADGYPSISANRYGVSAPTVSATASGQRLTINVDNCAPDYRTNVSFYTKVTDAAFSGGIVNGTEITIDNSASFNPDDGTTTVTDDGAVTFKPSVVSKSVSGVSGDIATWRVEINASELNIGGTTFEDTYTNVDSIVGGLSGITVSGATVTPVANGNGFKFDIPTGTNSKIIVTYKTKIDNLSATTKNTAKLSGGDVINYDVSSEATVPAAEFINKTLKSFDPVTKTFEWEVVINKDNKSLTNVVATDEFDTTYMEFVSVSGASYDASSDIANGKLVFKFDSLDTAQTITVVTRPKDLPELYSSVHKFENKATLKSDEISTPVEKTVTEWRQLEKITLLTKKGEDVTANDGTVTWTVEVKGQKLTPTGYEFVDYLPDNMNYVEGSFRIQEQYYDASPSYRTVTPAYDSESGKTVIRYEFDPVTDARFLGKQNYAFWIVYKTATKDYTDAEKTVTYHNEAKLKAEFPGSIVAEDTAKADVTTQTGGVLGKEYKYNHGDRKVTWTVKINEARADMSAIANPRISDKLASYFDYESGKLYKLDAAGNKIPVADSDYDAIVVNDLLTVRLPNIGSDCYIFEFTTIFNCIEALVPSSVINHVKLVGDGDITETSSSSLDSISFNSAVAGATVKRDIRIMKVDGDTDQPLEGAVFELYLDDKITLVGSATTDASGKAVFVDSNSLLGKVLYLKEVEAPAGYTLNSDWIKIDDYIESNLLTDPATGKRYYSKQVLNISSVERKGSVNLVKQDADDSSTTLAGAKYGLYSDSSCDSSSLILERETADDGTLSFGNLSVGEYWLKETASPAGYVIDATPIHVELSLVAGTVISKYAYGTETLTQQSVYTAKNTRAKAELVIVKKDADDTTTALADAVFGLYKDEACTVLVAKKTTAADGKAVFDNLEPGKTYYYREEVAPDGYVLDMTPKSVVIGQASDRKDSSLEREVLNTLRKGNIVIHKTDDAAIANPLEGVEFTLYTAGGTVPVTIEGVPYKVVTGSDGTAVFNDIPFGSYVIKETKGKAGYVAAADMNVTVSVAGDTNVSVVNNIIRFSINITKLESDNTPGDDTDNVKLKGVRFGLYNESGVLLAQGETDTEGKLAFENVAIRDYTGIFVIKELEAPDGYNKASDVIISNADALASANTGVAIAKTIYNDKQNGKLLVKKVDKNGNALAGATFRLLDSHKLTVATATSMTAAEAASSGVAGAEEGSVYFDGLKYGTYYLVEESAPATGGKVYIINTTEFEVVIDSDTVVTNVFDGAVPVSSIENDEQNQTPPVVSFWFGKEDTAGAALEGATFTMYRKRPADSEWTSIATAVSDASGKVFFRRVSIKDDPDDTEYKITETIAPEGYKKDVTTTVAINNKGWFGTRYSDSEDPGLALADVDIKELLEFGLSGAGVTFVNEQIKGAIRVRKLDSVTSQKLSGAKFGLYNPDGTTARHIDGTLVSEETTNDEGIVLFEELAIGTYIVKETEAPNGYALSSRQYSAVIGATGNPSVLLEVKDTPLGLNISKRALGETAELTGARLMLTDTDNNLIDEWTTTDTIHTIDRSKLVFGKHYVLRENVSPAGYGRSNPVYFSFNEDGTVVLETGSDANATASGNVVIMRDSPLQLSVSKLDIASVAVVGAVLELHKGEADGAVIATWTTNGESYQIGALLSVPVSGTNKYTIVEKTAPDEYEVAAPVSFVVDETGAIKRLDDTVISSINIIDVPKDGVYIRKMNESFVNISDAKLALFKKSDMTNAIATWTSSGTPKKFLIGSGSGELEEATEYVLVEQEAPKGYKKADDIVFKVVAGEITIISGGTTDTLNAAKNTINMIDKSITLRLRKIDPFGNGLAGAKLKLSVYDTVSEAAGDVVWDNITTTDGVLTVESAKLSLNTTYILEETGAPAGYLKASPIVFTIDGDGIVKREDLKHVSNNTVVMEDKEAGISVGKTEKTDNVAAPVYIKGARFKMTTVSDAAYRDDSFVEKEWTSSDTPESWPITDFKYGCKYTVTELSAPDGYTVAEPVTFLIDADTHNVYVDGVEQAMRTVLIADTRIKLNVAKVNSVTNEPVAGAKLTINDASNKEVASWTSTSAVKAVDTSKLKVGGSTEAEYAVYTLREVKAPEGYLTAEPIVFAIDSKGIIYEVSEDENGNRTYSTNTANVAGGAINLIKVEDEPETAIVKVDEDGEAVTGARLQIKPKNPSVDFETVTWSTSDTEVKYINSSMFDANEVYVLSEISAPKGYAYAKDVELMYDSDGKLFVDGEENSTGTVELLDKKLSVGVRKIDKSTGHDLKGATLSISDASGERIYTFETNGKKKLIPNDVLSTNKGELTEYVVKEVIAPDGYKIAKPIRFALDDEGRMYLKDSSGGYSVADSNVIIMEDAEDTGESPEDPETPPEEPAVPSKPPTVPGHPNTGDNAPIAGVVMILLITMYGLAILLRKRQK